METEKDPLLAFKMKVVKEAKNSIEISVVNSSTYIIAVAIHKDSSYNRISRLSCSKGIPLGGYIYDSQYDNYQIECVDYLHLGFIPFSFIVKIKGVELWNMRIPLSENLIKKHLSQLQKKELKNFQNQFKSSEYDIEFIQMIDPNK